MLNKKNPSRADKIDKIDDFEKKNSISSKNVIV